MKEPSIDYNKNPELRKLQFHGAGPKAAIPKVEGEEEGIYDLWDIILNKRDIILNNLPVLSNYSDLKGKKND